MANDSINVMKVIDERINVEQVPILIVSESTPSVQYSTINVAGNASNTPTFTIPCPPNQGLDRTVIMQMTVQFLLTGTDLQLFQQQPAIALRAWPLHNACTSMNIQLGTAGVSINPSQYAAALLTQWNCDSYTQALNLSSFPSAPDRYATYATASLASSSPFDSDFASPNSNYANTSRTGQITSINYYDGAFVLGQPAPAPVAWGANATQLVITATVYEPIAASPFVYTGIRDPKKAFFGLGNVNVNLSFTNLQRMLSYFVPEGATITSTQGQFTSQSLQVAYINAFEDSVSNYVSPMAYNYSTIQTSTATFVCGDGTTNPVSVQVPSTTMQLGVVPSHFLIWATPPSTFVNSETQSLPDFCFTISNVSINFAGKDNILGSNCTPLQLFNISKKNGSNTTFPQWSGAQILTSATQTNPANAPQYFGGGVLILKTSEDLRLPSTSCAGMNRAINFQINATCTNLSGIDFGANCQFNVLAITDGVCITQHGSRVQLIEGGITEDMYNNAEVVSGLQEMAVKNYENKNGYSGGSWASFKSDMAKFAKYISPMSKPIIGALTNKAVAGIEGAGRMNRGKIRGLLKGMY